MMLPSERILADQIAFERLHGSRRSFEEAPGAGFTEAGNMLIRGNLHEQVAIDRQDLNVGDFQGNFAPSGGSQCLDARPSQALPAAKPCTNCRRFMDHLLLCSRILA